MLSPYNYQHWGINLGIVAGTFFAVSLVVMIHYEGLVALLRSLPRINIQVRSKLVVVIFVVILLHVLEIWVFALVELFLMSFAGAGAIVGQTTFHVFDFVYLSTITFTTVGYGDLVPTGPIRFIYGTESLVGFVLITWSASFAFLEMQHYWRKM